MAQPVYVIIRLKFSKDMARELNEQMEKCGDGAEIVGQSHDRDEIVYTVKLP